MEIKNPLKNTFLITEGKNKYKLVYNERTFLLSCTCGDVKCSHVLEVANTILKPAGKKVMVETSKAGNVTEGLKKMRVAFKENLARTLKNG